LQAVPARPRSAVNPVAVVSTFEAVYPGQLSLVACLCWIAAPKTVPAQARVAKNFDEYILTKKNPLDSRASSHSLPASALYISMFAASQHQQHTRLLARWYFGHTQEPSSTNPPGNVQKQRASLDISSHHVETTFGKESADDDLCLA
jgi:hypothetical protein